MKDFYKELNTALISYEDYKAVHPMKMDAIADKIDWCWKWKKINRAQMEELADRATKIFERGDF